MTLPGAVPRSLPLAPRPFADESIRSWIGRVAARYDLPSVELVARLRDGPGVHVLRLFSLDWRKDAEFDHLLAQAARLDEARIRALRLVMTDRPKKPALWHRTLLAWCPACACEDVVCHGEIYERAIWRLGCCAVCPTHRLVLADACPICTFGRVGFQAVTGRQRLVCTLCKRPVDASPDTGRGAAFSIGGASPNCCNVPIGPLSPLPFRQCSSAWPVARLRRIRGGLVFRCTTSRSWCATWLRLSCGQRGWD
jgi:TniQ protein